MQGRKRVAIVLAVTVVVFVASVIATAATRSHSGASPDRPPFAQEADGDYLQLRDEYEGRLRGIEPGLFTNPTWRALAVKTRLRQEKQLGQQAAPSISTPAWSEIGPASVSNGQALSGGDTRISGRVTAIAVDPTDLNKVYLGTAQGGVWRSLNGGSSWTPIFDTAQSLSIGALAVAPSSPSTVYVGTGEPNLSADSFFGVGLYRIDNADTSAALVGPINPQMTFTCDPAVCVGSFTTNAFTGRAISKILVSPADAATVFVSTSTGRSGLGGNALSNTVPPLGLRGVYRSTNATAAAGSVAFQKLAVSTGASLDSPATGSRSVTDMTFVNSDPNKLLASAFGLAAANDGGIFLTANALAGTPSFAQTLTVQSDHMAFAGLGNTVLVASDESTASGGGRVRESTDGGATWPTNLTAADGFCGGQCSYDIVMGIDPNSTGPNYRIYLGGSARGTHTDGMKLSTDGGTTFARDDIGLHADTHAIVFDSSIPSTVWVGNDGGVWKRSAVAAAGTAWTNLNNGLGTLQFQSVAVGKSDAVFGIGGTQDNGTELQQTSLGTWSQTDFGDGGYTLIDQSTTSTSTVTMYHTYFNETGSLIGFARTNSSACAGLKDWSFRGFGFTDGTIGCNGDAAGATNGIGSSNAVEFYAPMALGPGTPNTLYFGTDRLYRSTNKGDAMTVVSQGPIVSGSPITTIGISPANDNVRIVGLQNGQVWATATGSSALTNVTSVSFPANLNGSTNKWVGRAVIDPNDPNTAYVTFSYYATAGQSVWKTTNLSAATPTWTAAASGIPSIPVNAFMVDPNDSMHLFAGTDVGVYASTDGGATWSPFGTGLPAVAIFDMAIVQPGTGSEALRVATHGRGMWQIALPGSKSSQTISFGTLANRTFGDSDFTVGATASSGLTVSFSASGGCTVSGTTVHITGAGSCSITAAQAGDGTYNSAPDVVQSFTIAKADQTISFAALPARPFGFPDFPIGATASSGLAVAFAATGDCTLSGSTLHITGAGSCTVTASQAGNANYNAAPAVAETFAVAKSEQSITFGVLPSKTWGDPDFTVIANASSGLAVAFAAAGNCTVSGATVHLTGAGLCTLTASQSGDANYNAAPIRPQPFAIAKVNQTITFGALANKALGGADFAVSATASSGLKVSFTFTGSCTLSGVTVHLTAVGSCTLTASQSGDANYNPAADVSRSFTIAPRTAKCTVPRVVGKTLAAAKTSLKKRHCRAGRVSRAYSKKTKKGRVSAQSRRPGKVLPANTKVNLVVSRGRKL
jgi:hypothetical protein